MSWYSRVNWQSQPACTRSLSRSMRSGTWLVGRQLPQGQNPRQHRRMAVIERHVERMRGQVGQIADAQFFQPADQGFTLAAAFSGIAVGLVFVAPGKGVQSDADQGGERGIE